MCITGNVGSGKSSLLSAITGDMHCVRGSISLQDVTTGFGFVAQNAWLQRGTIRNNIVWGQVYDAQWYGQVVHACGLVDDLQQLGGDDTFVGDKGLTLSGGQRMRVALARAVYQNKQIYLLDDVLSCLDAHVANHVIKYCIFGLLATKTRLVVTDQRAVVRRATQVLHFVGGEVTVHDPATSSSYTSDQSEDEDGDRYEEQGQEEEDPKKKRQLDRRAESQRLGEKSREKIAAATQEDKEDGGVHFEERMETGELKRSTLLAYWRALTGRLGCAVLVAVALMQISRNLSDVVLAEWVAAATDSSNSTDTAGGSDGKRLMGVYAGVVVVNSLLTAARAFLFAYAGIKAAVVMHKKLLKGVVYVSDFGMHRHKTRENYSVAGRFSICFGHFQAVGAHLVW